MKKLIVLLFAVIAIAGLTAFYLYKEETPDVVTQKPEWILSAGDLLNAFETDSLDASKKFLDKVIEVSGTIQQIDTSGSLLLGEINGMSVVTAGFDRRHLEELQSLKEGNTITIQGICTGYSKASGDDLLADLGVTVELRAAGIKR